MSEKPALDERSSPASSENDEHQQETEGARDVLQTEPIRHLDLGERSTSTAVGVQTCKDQQQSEATGVERASSERERKSHCCRRR